MADRRNNSIIRQIVVTEDDETLWVALGENQDSSGRAIVFQRARYFDEQDRALGMDTYCISDAMGATVYGGVLRYRLDENILTLHLTPETATVLAMNNPYRCALQTTPAMIAQLRFGLRRVLHDDADNIAPSPTE